MVKRKARSSSKKIAIKKPKYERAKNLRTKITCKIQKKREPIEKEKRPAPSRESVSSNYSYESSSLYHLESPKRKKYSSKRSYRRVSKKDKEKNAATRNNLRTCYENPSYSGSNESLDLKSLESQISHIHVIESRSDQKLSTNSNQRTSYSSMLSSDKRTDHFQTFAEIDGIKLVKSNINGSSTEIVFQPALVMHVRKTPANLDVRPDNQDHAVSSVNCKKEISREVNSVCTGIFQNKSANLTKIPDHNLSVSKAALLGVKSSQNCTDINSQRRVQYPDGVRRIYLSSNGDVREIMPPIPMKNSTADLKMVRTVSTKHCNVTPVSTRIQFPRHSLFPRIANSLGSQFSHLQSLHTTSTFRQNSADANPSCSHDTIFTQAAQD